MGDTELTPHGGHPPACTCWHCNEGEKVRLGEAIRRFLRDRAVRSTLGPAMSDLRPMPQAQPPAQSPRPVPPAPRHDDGRRINYRHTPYVPPSSTPRPRPHKDAKSRRRKTGWGAMMGATLIIVLIASGAWVSMDKESAERREFDWGVYAQPFRDVLEGWFQASAVGSVQSGDAQRPAPTRDAAAHLGIERFSKVHLEDAIRQRVNDYRVSNGVNALLWDEQLATVARAHSADMAGSGYYPRSHVNRRGEGPTERAARGGYTCDNPRTIGVAENAFLGYAHSMMWGGGSYTWYTPEELVDIVVDGWIGSAGHRKNLLDARYRKTGVGIEFGRYQGVNHAVFVTHKFC